MILNGIRTRRNSIQSDTRRHIPNKIRERSPLDMVEGGLLQAFEFDVRCANQFQDLSGSSHRGSRDLHLCR